MTVPIVESSPGVHDKGHFDKIFISKVHVCHATPNFLIVCIIDQFPRQEIHIAAYVYKHTDMYITYIYIHIYIYIYACVHACLYI